MNDCTCTGLCICHWRAGLTALVVLLAACTPKPPDVPVCEHLDRVLVVDPATGHQMLDASPACLEKIGEPVCGHCVYIVSGKEIFVGEDPKNFFEGMAWSEIRDSSVQVPAKSYADLAAYIINACKKTGCSEDVTRFRVRIGKLKSAK